MKNSGHLVALSAGNKESFQSHLNFNFVVHSLLCSSTEFTPGKADATFDQMPPTNTWGVTFGLVPFPGQMAEYLVNVLAKEDNTEFYVGKTQYTLSNAGKSMTIPVDIARYVVISSNKPLLIGQLAKVEADNQADYPSSLLVTPYEQFKSSYNFVYPYIDDSTSGITFTRYILLVSGSSSTDSVLLDSESLGGSWQSMESNSLALSGIQQQLDYRRHTLTSSTSNVIGLMVYGNSSGGCGYAFTPDMCLDDLSQVSHVQ